MQTRDEDKQRVAAENKRKIHRNFKSELGLLVNRPKPGFGNTNGGNTAHRFFNRLLLSSQITVFDEKVIERIKVILRTISSGFDVNYILQGISRLIQKIFLKNLLRT
ncbi:hypothetical protein JTB14_037920 [Gonioctena quinquepunctata]|nr:hypothetical protein JTB14_037920 [Gonioctena quinquepunctata]